MSRQLITLQTLVPGRKDNVPDCVRAEQDSPTSPPASPMDEDEDTSTRARSIHLRRHPKWHRKDGDGDEEEEKEEESDIDTFQPVSYKVEQRLKQDPDVESDRWQHADSDVELESLPDDGMDLNIPVKATQDLDDREGIVAYKVRLALPKSVVSSFLVILVSVHSYQLAEKLCAPHLEGSRPRYSRTHQEAGDRRVG